MTYKRRFALWRKGHLLSPRFNDVKNLQFPRGAIYHYVDAEGITLGPNITDPLIVRVPGIKYIDHVTTLLPAGKPDPNPIRKLSSSVASCITKFKSLRGNRAFRPVRKLEALNDDPRSIIVYNYAIINNTMTYPRSGKTEWFMFRSLMNTLITQINQVSKESTRENYLIIELPNVLPSLTMFRELITNKSVGKLATIPSFEEKFIFDMFSLVGRGQKESWLGKLSEEALNKTNIVLKRFDKWAVVNLGWLLSFSKTYNEKGMYDPTRYEVVFLGLLNSLHAAGVPFVATVDATVVDTTEEEDMADEEEELSIVDDTEDDEIAEAEERAAAEELLQETIVEDDEAHEVLYDLAEIEKLEKDLMELERLREISRVKIEDVDEEGDFVDADVDDPNASEPALDIDTLSKLNTVAEGVSPAVAKAEELLSLGMMTAPEFNRVVRNSERFAEIECPYDSTTTIEKFKDIPAVAVKVKSEKFTEDAVVVDKSMASSRVDDFRKNHVNVALKRQMLSCLSAIQKGPISVLDYKVEVTKDAVNEYETHILRLAPAVGVPSTFRQIIPIVKEDGTFKYNGNVCMMRPQRSDLPIKKITDSRVALSSYYGKCFIDRSEKRRFNFGNWLTSALVMKCQDPEDLDISAASLSDCTNFKVDVPNVYARCATRISYFEASGLRLNFDYDARIKLFKFTDEELALAKKGEVLIGRTIKGKWPLVMDKKGVIYSFRSGGVETREGSLNEICNLDIGKAPVDSTEIKIYSKSIPAGFGLGYLLGLDELLKLLGSNPRQVLAGKQLKLTSSEYAIRFKNVSLIFNREDQLISSIMGGWNQYAKVISNYNLESFNSRDVYSAVMDKMGIGNMYVRELDSMNTYFLDPMTTDLLKLMEEPTSFTGLLVRATEMLLNSHIPVKLDKENALIGSLERVRGYERFAGFAYETMTKAVKNYNARIGSGKSSVTVNPYETVMNIMTDPTVSSVDNINPIQYLREREVITTSGRGGRSKRAMVARTRVYTNEDMGFVSEASVDSGDVGIINYLSPDANISTIYGTVSTYDPKIHGAGKLLSSASLLTPTADGDDQY